MIISSVQKGLAMGLPRIRFSLWWMMVAVIFAALLLAAFDAGRRWERVHRRRGALRVQTVRHVGPWQLNNIAIPARRGPTSDHSRK
jgi:hypothetical protein